MSKQANIDNAYNAALALAQTRIAEIQAALEAEAAKQAINGGTVKTNFGHVGSVAGAAADLTEIADRLLGRGEYA